MQEKLVILKSDSLSVSELNQMAELQQEQSKLDTVPRQPFQMNEKQKRNSCYTVQFVLVFVIQGFWYASIDAIDEEAVPVTRYFHAISPQFYYNVGVNAN